MVARRRLDWLGLIMVCAFPILALAGAYSPLIGAQRRLSPHLADCHNSRRLSTPEFSTAALHFGAITAVVMVLARLLAGGCGPPPSKGRS
jgi:hypothetical protein